MTSYKNILPEFVIRKAVGEALQEDLGHAGDITTNAVVSDHVQTQAFMNARHDGVIAGLGFAETSFKLLSNNFQFQTTKQDGDKVFAGEQIATLSGSSKALLTGERVALNFLGYLSGIATHTNQFVEAVKGTNAKICCTRKTTPGLRNFEKYAVRTGGGTNHRFGLDDAVMIKDNHIAIAGSITKAVEAVKQNVGHTVKIEVEVDTLEQLDELLQCGADIVLLDNMPPETLYEAVKMINKSMIIEASGGITLDNVRQIAETGVDLISIGALTHSSRVLDIGLDFD